MESQEQRIECRRRSLYTTFPLQQLCCLRTQTLLQQFIHLNGNGIMLHIQEKLMVLDRDTFVIEIAMLIRMHLHFDALLNHQFIR